jgi:hypothetical protein
MCPGMSLVQLHAAFNGAACVGLMPSYKHIAPPKQRPEHKHIAPSGADPSHKHIAPPEQRLHEFSTRKTLKRVRRSAKPFQV